MESPLSVIPLCANSYLPEVESDNLPRSHIYKCYFASLSWCIQGLYNRTPDNHCQPETIHVSGFSPRMYIYWLGTMVTIT